jgi:DNA-binding transcriptional LysR family regulator
MITLDRLRYFCEVAKLQHVGQASKSLNISASAISDAIKALEYELSCKLFTRVNNKIKINNNGIALLAKAQIILHESDNLSSYIHKAPMLLKGHFTIAASPYLMKHYLIDACLKVKDKNPEASFTFISLETSEAVEKTVKGDIDVALIFKSLEYKGIASKALYSGSFEIAVNKSNEILDIPKSKRITNLNQLPAITFKPNASFNYVENHPVFKTYSISPKHTYFYNNNDASILLLKKTKGWALLPDLIIDKHNKSIKKVSISKEWNAPYEVALIQRESDTNSMLKNLLYKELKTKL